MRALVTGVAGFVGSTLADRLIEDESIDSVVGVDAFTDYYHPNRKRRNVQQLLQSERFKLVEADLNHCDLEELLKDVDVVYHQAGQPGVRKSWGTTFGSYVSANIEATQHLLEAARASRALKRFVYASSSSVYGNSTSYPTDENTLPVPYSPYGVTKLAAEHLVSLYANNYGVPSVSLRYFTVYGPRQRPDMGMHKFISNALAREPIKVFGDGNQVRDFTYIDDIVRANIAAGEADSVPLGLVVNICGGSTVSVNDVLSGVERSVGGPIEVDYTQKVPGDVTKTAGTNAAAKSWLGWAPTVGIAEGLARHVEYVRKEMSCAIG